MMSNDADRTVFQQPKPATDQTMIKPAPSRRPNPRVHTPTRGAARPTPAPNIRTGIEKEPTYFRNESGLNPLANAASTLTAVFEKTRQSPSHNDVGGLHRRLVSEIKALDARLRQLEYKNEIVLSARYVMCVALDEAVLNTPWGSSSPWAQRTLLSVFHNETSGGEKFFKILDRMRQAPSENIDIIELFYILLSLGFEGKYRIVNRGKEQIELIRDELFNMIRSHRGEYERELASSWHGLGSAKRTLTDFIPMWVIGVMALTLLFTSYSGFRYWLYESATPVAERLQALSEKEESAEQSTQQSLFQSSLK